MWPLKRNKWEAMPVNLEGYLPSIMEKSGCSESMNNPIFGKQIITNRMSSLLPCTSISYLLHSDLYPERPTLWTNSVGSLKPMTSCQAQPVRSTIRRGKSGWVTKHHSSARDSPFSRAFLLFLATTSFPSSFSLRDINSPGVQLQSF